MDMIGKVRRMHRRDNKSVREIARLTGLSRNTVAKWLEAPLEGQPQYRRGPQPSKLTAFHEALKQALKADSHRPRHERRTARALYAEAKAGGYEGGYTRVTDFVRAWRGGKGQGLLTKAFVPLAFEWGEAFQFDWSEEGLVVGGIYRRLQVSHMKLCASRAFWLVAYLIPQCPAAIAQPGVEFGEAAELHLVRLDPDAPPAVLHVLLDDTLLPARRNVAEVSVEQVVRAHHGEALVDGAALAPLDLVDRGQYASRGCRAGRCRPWPRTTGCMRRTASRGPG